MAGREFACEDITVAGCTFLHGHGMSIGSETDGVCAMWSVKIALSGHRERPAHQVSARKGRSGGKQSATADITMTNVDPAITFTCYYMNNSAKDARTRLPQMKPARQRPVEKSPFIGNIRVSNLKAACQKSAGVIRVCRRDCMFQCRFLKTSTFPPAPGLAIRNAQAYTSKIPRWWRRTARRTAPKTRRSKAWHPQTRENNCNKPAG